MQRAPRRDTKPELALRSALHQRGLRFFVDRAPIPSSRRRADLLFPTKRVAIYVDGCYWHGCPVHGTWPKANAEWWREKIDGNRARDRDTDRMLHEAGWTSVRIWEHEAVDEAAERVLVALGRAAPAPPAALHARDPSAA
jgi:DNA mismatch endonuclease (patch repair protein)